MKIEIDADFMTFEGMKINADDLLAMLTDPDHFYRLSNDGKYIYIERFEGHTLDKLIQL